MITMRTGFEAILDLVKKYKLYLIGGGALVVLLLTFFMFLGDDAGSGEDFTHPVRKSRKQKRQKADSAGVEQKNKKKSAEDIAEIARKKAEKEKVAAIAEAESFKFSTIHIDELIKRLRSGNLADKYYNAKGDYKNSYKLKVVKGSKVVVDKASGLMWMQDGSADYHVFGEVEKWVTGLRQRGYAGYHDWRLPTVNEAATLLENKEASGSLYIDSIFSGKQPYIWTGDVSAKKGHRWALDFYGGDWNEVPEGTAAYIRLVRKNQ